MYRNKELRGAVRFILAAGMSRQQRGPLRPDLPTYGPIELSYLELN